MKSETLDAENPMVPENEVLGTADRDSRLKDVSDRLAYLATVEDGWFEGRGVALDRAGLRWLERRMAEHYVCTELPLPFLFPTVPAGVMAEWTLERFECAIEIDLEARTGSWVEVDMETGEGIDEQVLGLDSADGWRWLVDRLRGFEGES